MAVNVTVNGTTYSLPTTGGKGWGSIVTAFLQAVASSLTPAILGFGSASPGTDTAARFLGPWYSTMIISSTEAYVRAPFAGTISGLYVQCSTAPTTQGYVITVRKNGVDTAVTATLAGGATQASDTSNSFAVAAGDRISVKSVGVTGITIQGSDLTVTMQLAK